MKLFKFLSISALLLGMSPWSARADYGEVDIVVREGVLAFGDRNGLDFDFDQLHYLDSRGFFLEDQNVFIFSTRIPLKFSSTQYVCVTTLNANQFEHLSTRCYILD